MSFINKSQNIRASTLKNQCFFCPRRAAKRPGRGFPIRSPIIVETSSACYVVRGKRAKTPRSSEGGFMHAHRAVKSGPFARGPGVGTFKRKSVDRAGPPKTTFFVVLRTFSSAWIGTPFSRKVTKLVVVTQAGTSFS